MPLIAADVFIDDSVNGINFVTQDVPLKATDFLNQSVITIQQTGENVVSETIKNRSCSFDIFSSFSEVVLLSTTILSVKRVPVYFGR